MNDTDDEQATEDEEDRELSHDTQDDDDYQLEILGAGHWPESPDWPDEAA